MKKIAIIGQGYVGLTLSAFALKDYQVVGFDSNKKLVDQLNLGNSHIEGVESKRLARGIKSGNYKATTKGADISDVEIVLIAVPTPLTIDRQPDLTHLNAACETIGNNINQSVLIINESTSYPGTLRTI